eukprot:Gregarina_sp_Poly_1__7768@NODE_439_length_8392_cov_737_725405_g358_i0_p3_GENE_NODE_439_length_8392_cov_737_725405_g358_i0NODE_439_length_8392_cov_737_725405_g358_i0_p3_ORF_typecomplete_len133_score4_98Robl_LC7/PF03259_17/0_091_NODE_439_length_8392_cov_737_725405_g358_i050315429
MSGRRGESNGGARTTWASVLPPEERETALGDTETAAVVSMMELRKPRRCVTYLTREEATRLEILRATDGPSRTAVALGAALARPETRGAVFAASRTRTESAGAMCANAASCARGSVARLQEKQFRQPRQSRC